MRKFCTLLVCSLACFMGNASQLHIIPDTLGDPHFTSGPCPMIAPRDGAICPNGSATCPAFYNPGLLPAGYNSVSYCAEVPAGIGNNSPGYTLLTMPLDTREQQAFLLAAKKVETYVKDPVTVVTEVYKVAYLCTSCSGQPNYLFFGASEYWNPVCGVDALLPPFSGQAPTIIQNPDGSYGYKGMPETYTPILIALQFRNSLNMYPMKLINYLPSVSQINVEWPSQMYAWQTDTGLDAYQVDTDFLVGPANYYRIAANAKSA